jgi:hypothetical protein
MGVCGHGIYVEVAFEVSEILVKGLHYCFIFIELGNDVFMA